MKPIFASSDIAKNIFDFSGVVVRYLLEFLYSYPFVFMITIWDSAYDRIPISSLLFDYFNSSIFILSWIESWGYYLGILLNIDFKRRLNSSFIYNSNKGCFSYYKYFFTERDPIFWDIGPNLSWQTISKTFLTPCYFTLSVGENQRFLWNGEAFDSNRYSLFVSSIEVIQGRTTIRIEYFSS